MSRFLHKFSAILLVTALLLSACNAANPLSSGEIQEQITQTMQAVATDAQATLQAAVPTLAPATNTPLPTATSLPTETPAPTQTPAPTETPVPVVPDTSTPEPVILMAHIDSETNCRSGASTSFPIIYTASAGEDLKVVSRSTLADYVVVENPQNPGQSCWLWTQHVTFNGDLSGLSAVTPPPTPTQSLVFNLAFYRIEQCSGWSLAFKVVNTGAKALQSYKIVAIDQSANTQETSSSNEFDRRDGCSVEDPNDLVNPGENGYIYADRFSFDPSGHSILATITVCTHNELAGTCLTQVLMFTP